MRQCYRWCITLSVLKLTTDQVVGVEMVQEAVRDAIKNAEENKVTRQQKIAKTVDFSFKSIGENKHYQQGDKLQVFCWQG